MTQQNINILLEVSHTGEWVFSIVNDALLKANIFKFTSIKQKNKSNDIENVRIQMFYAKTIYVRKEKSDPSHFESVFITEPDTLVQQEEVKVENEETVQLPKISKELASLQKKKLPKTLPWANEETEFQCPTCKLPLTRKDGLESHLRNNHCFKRMVHGFKKEVLRCLSYLPEGLVLPNLNNLKLPCSQEVIQPDGTTAYINQSVRSQMLFVTNFDFKDLKCEICNDKFKILQLLLTHRTKVHFFPGNKQTCNGCQKFCETPKEKRLHTYYCLKREQIIPRFCYDCNLLFDDDLTHRLHLVKEHPENRVTAPQSFSCDIAGCNTKFTQAGSKAVHMRTFHKEMILKIVSCAHCDFNTDNKNKLRKHLITTHFPRLSEGTCDYCIPPKHFDTKWRYLRHMAWHKDHLDQVPPNSCKVKEERVENSNQSDDEVEIVSNPLEKVLILDSDEHEEDTIVQETDFKKYEKPPRNLLSQGKKTGTRLKAIKCAEEKPAETNSINSIDLTAVKYPKRVVLQKDLSTPDSNAFRKKYIQSDGTIMYLSRSGYNGKLWITNFDLFSLKCELCDEKYDNLSPLLHHRKDIHFFPSNVPKCVACSKVCETNDEKREHILYCPEKSKLDIGFCYLCNTQFDDYIALHLHSKQYHKMPFEKNESKKKPKIQESPRIYECHHCKYLGSPFIMKKHLITTHFTSLAKHKCTKCQPTKYFHNLTYFLRHQNSHGNPNRQIRHSQTDEKFQCPHCNDVFGQKYMLNAHIRQKHEEPKPQETEVKLEKKLTLPCTTCGKLFLSQGHLRSHERNHLPDSQRKYQCQFCPRGFNACQALIEHERDHTGEKPYKCEYCGKCFAKKQTFNDHVKTHTGQGYKCDHCERMLWDHSSFRKHLKTHEAQLGIKLTYTKEERRLKRMGLL